MPTAPHNAHKRKSLLRRYCQCFCPCRMSRQFYYHETREAIAALFDGQQATDIRHVSIASLTNLKIDDQPIHATDNQLINEKGVNMDNNCQNTTRFSGQPSVDISNSPEISGEYFPYPHIVSLTLLRVVSDLSADLSTVSCHDYITIFFRQCTDLFIICHLYSFCVLRIWRCLR